MRRGFFLVLEGPEGSGKTTLAQSLLARMREDGVDVMAVREPGGTPVAEALRSELLDAARPWTAEAELLYMATARSDLVTRVIRPALERGTTVVSDRFDLSTLAYQGAGRGLPLAHVKWVNAAATGGLVPGLTLVLDLDPAEGRKRQALMGKGADRLEREPETFHELVAAAYRDAHGPGVFHLDGHSSPGRVLASAWSLCVAARPETFHPRPE